MNEQQVKRALQSVGMVCFVKYFHLFADTSISNSNLIDILMKEEDWKENGCKTRVSQARRILEEEKASEALQMIINSDKIDTNIKNEAYEIFKHL